MSRPAARPGTPPLWRRGLSVGRIGATAIVIAPSWFVSVVVIVVVATPIVNSITGIGSRIAGIAVALLLAVLLGLSVLIHELGHCAVAALVGIRVREIRLYLVGGVSELSRPPASAAQEALVAAAGPVASAVVAAISAAVVPSTDRFGVAWLIAVEMVWCNGIVAVFNILPALPLDGGRVLRAALWRLGRSQRIGTIAGCLGGFVVAMAMLTWAALSAARPEHGGILRAVVIAVMALFVGAGAAGEWPTEARLAEDAAAGSAVIGDQPHPGT